MSATVLSGKPHPGTPLRILQSQYGYFLGFLDPDGNFYSRESTYYTDALAAAGDLDLLQMQAVPFKMLRIPLDMPQSTPGVLTKLTQGTPVRGETEADPDFRPPLVNEEDDAALISTPAPAHDPAADIARTYLMKEAEELGLEVGPAVPLADLVEMIEEAKAVTPPSEDELEVPLGD